jgi:integrase
VNSDYQFKWDLITSYLGNDDTTIEDRNDNDDLEEEQQEEDRPYNKEEIKKMFNGAQDIRIKIVISLLSSSGLRQGALPNLKLRDLEKIEKYQLYQITAYRKSKKYSYKTFCTPECSTLIDTYLLYRKNQGEQLKDTSPLIREQFNTTDKLKVNNPRHLTSVTFRFLINDVLTKYTTLRKKLKFDYENKRKIGKNSTMLTHAFRKFFSTECAKLGVYPDFIELMLGHKLPGMRSHYMKPDINTLLEGTKEVKGYVAAIDSLTINDENRLSKQVQELEETKDYQQFVIDKKLKEKDEQISLLSSQLNDIAKQFKEINQRTKIDRDILKKMSSKEKFQLFLNDMDQKQKKKQKLLEQVNKIV